MSPFSARPGGLHCAPSFGTQKALRVDTKHTSSAQPVSIRHFHNAIAGLQQYTSVMSFSINLSSQYLIKSYTTEILQICIFFSLIFMSIKGYIQVKKTQYTIKLLTTLQQKLHYFKSLGSDRFLKVFAHQGYTVKL